MGSLLSSSMSDIFLDLMETTLIDKFIKRRQILHWSRYLSFTVKNMHNDRLKFFDMNIFIGNSKIKFRIFFQKDLDTVFTNYTKSVSPQRYKNGAIFTQLHRVRDCCSDETQFSICLDEL